MKLDTVLRIALGAMITAAGVGKLLDVPGFVGVVHTYRLGLPDSVVWVAAVTVLAFELVLGIWMLSGWHPRTAAALSAAMHAGYFVLLTVTLLRGIELANCGCFGVFLARPLTWRSPLWDLLYVAISYRLFRKTYLPETTKGTQR